MPIQGSNLRDVNFRLRFFILVFMGLIAVASVFYWRNQTLRNAEYVSIPTHRDDLNKYEELHSKNFQIEVQDSSPTVK
ncbi:MAG TPA: hypothetical protein VHQ20_01130 [Patescibacteria group bacterium]|jgi:hypothetical protein|nr:hypothetical protein [Patescibacteria group bacterium]